MRAAWNIEQDLQVHAYVQDLQVHAYVQDLQVTCLCINYLGLPQSSSCCIHHST